jgi:hypothetical protein
MATKTKTARKPTTARAAMNMCRKAGMDVDLVTVAKDYRTFTVRSENAANRVMKLTGWGYTSNGCDAYVMHAESFGGDYDNCM